MAVLTSASDTKYLHQLPTVSFRIIEDKTLEAPAGVKSEQARSFGYNDFSDFELPVNYIRYIEPIESELRAQVEYDMDEQDQAWLDGINAERTKDQSGPISYEIFEIIMDRLEKEWFELIKKIPQPASHLPVEDSKCAICDDGEGENSNAIVFCDGCNLAVHQDCYGVPYIPEGQWLCRKCTVSPENPVSCLFCPNEGGAFKQTTTGHWAHLLCAIWLPELSVGNAIYMEPVEGVETIPKNRWKLICSLCREKVGACIQCDNKACFTAFHVTCARQVGLLQGMKSMGADSQLRAFCHKHLPADAEGVADMDDELDSDYDGTPVNHSRKQPLNGGTVVTTKSARAHTKSYRPGPPIVPNIIVQNILNYISRVSIRKRQPFVERLCRYWSLKREARRGAPLLKRLHLEPWTASAASKQQSEAEKALKLMFLTKLRNDLERVRTLAELVRKREKAKLQQSRLIKEVVDNFLFPNDGQLRVTLEKISAMDRQDLFLHPVNPSEVPDYFTVIKEPMCWSFIDDKLETNQYSNVEDFILDIQLVIDNAMLYNKPETSFHRAAKRIKENSKPLLENLQTIQADFTSALLGDESPKDPSPHSVIGNLETTTLSLQALTMPEPGEERDYLASLFAYELEKPKPPTPPPPTPPPPKKRETAEERRQRQAERAARAKERVRARPTRASLAMEQAFAQEAGVAPNSSDVEGPSTRRSRARGVKDEPENSETPAESSSSGAKHGSRLQTGVAGYEAFVALSDRDRREKERQLDLITEEVGNHDQFTRFNVGWVLPEGSKRKRPERSEPPRIVPRKRKSEAGSSATPVVAPVSLPPVSAKEEGPSRSSRTPSPMGSSLTPVSTPQLSSIDEGSRPVSVRGKRSAIQTQPSTYAARDNRRKSLRARPAAEETEETEAVEDPTTGTDTNDVPKDDELTPVPPTSPLSVESEEEVEEEEEKEEEKHTIEAKRPRRADGKGKQTGSPTAEASLSNVGTSPVKKGKEKAGRGGAVGLAPKLDNFESLLEPRLLVWARAVGYPYFPGEIIDVKAPRNPIPPRVLNDRAAIEKQNNAQGQKTWLIRFYDTHATYSWLPASKLDLLGHDDDLDAFYLAGGVRGSGKGFKRTEMKKSVAKAYRSAVAEVPGGDEEEAAEDEEE